MSLFGIKEKEKLVNAIQEKNIIIEGFKTKEIKYSGEIQKLISEKSFRKLYFR